MTPAWEGWIRQGTVQSSITQGYSLFLPKSATAKYLSTSPVNTMAQDRPLLKVIIFTTIKAVSKVAKKHLPISQPLNAILTLTIYISIMYSTTSTSGSLTIVQSHLAWNGKNMAMKTQGRNALRPAQWDIPTSQGWKTLLTQGVKSLHWFLLKIPTAIEIQSHLVLLLQAPPAIIEIFWLYGPPLLAH